MNVYLASASCCCSFGGNPSDDISLDETILLVRQDGTIVKDYSIFSNNNLGGFKEGETYTAKKFWVIRKSYREFARFEDKKEAEKEYNRILEELSATNTVVKV